MLQIKVLSLLHYTLRRDERHKGFKKPRQQWGRQYAWKSTLPRNRVYFAIIPSCLHSILLTKFASKWRVRAPWKYCNYREQKIYCYVIVHVVVKTLSFEISRCYPNRNLHGYRSIPIISARSACATPASFILVHFFDVLQSSPFLPTQQLKELFRPVEYWRVSLLIMSTQCITWKRSFPHFSPLDKNIFPFTSLWMQGSECDKTNVHGYFSFTNWIFNNSRPFLALISVVRGGTFTGYRLIRGTLLSVKQRREMTHFEVL